MRSILLRADKIAFTLVISTLIILPVIGCSVDTNGYEYKSNGVYRPVKCEPTSPIVIKCYSK